MLNKIKKYLPLIILIAALPAVGLGCRNTATPQPITLEYWRVFDNSDALDEIIASYRASHPNVTINVRKLRFEEYENEIIEALAEDRGPDIFSIHNTWIGEYESKIKPLPPTVTTIERSIEEGIRDTVVFEQVTKKSLTTSDISRGFLDVVAKDVIRPDATGQAQIWGVPLGVDTLVMFYNRDILNRADIATAPNNWNEFLDAVSRITRLDSSGNILVGGAALGTADNIVRFSDILSVLMMQNGAIMTNAANQATFHLIPSTFTTRGFVPGIEALRFYTDFAQPNKNAYSWNNDMPDSLEAFMQERVAFFFGYSYHIPILQAQAPGLRWEVTSIPQADAENNKVNFANYWVETVSKKSKNTDEAWNFIQFAASRNQVPKYLQKTKKSTALRSLIDEQKADIEMAPFANQLLTAQSWYRGKDVNTAEDALKEMINTILITTDQTEINAIVNRAVGRINQTIR